MAQKDMGKFVHDYAVLTWCGLARINHYQVVFSNPHGEG